jgi:hypothetical protein
MCWRKVLILMTKDVKFSCIALEVVADGADASQYSRCIEFLSRQAAGDAQAAIRLMWVWLGVGNWGLARLWLESGAWHSSIDVEVQRGVNHTCCQPYSGARLKG